MTTTEKQFLALLRLALHSADILPSVLSLNNIDWEGIFDIAKAQSVLGVIFPGVTKWKQHAPANVSSNHINEELFAKWYGLTVILRQRNTYLTHISSKIVSKFNSVGFRACILKGQGNALLYERNNGNREMTFFRTPGDIDVWVMPNGVTTIADARKRVVEYIHRLCPSVEEAFLHIRFPLPVGASVEVHYVPMMDAAPWRNRRMWHFLEEHAADCFGNMTSAGFAVLVNPLNGLFQLYHIRRHFIKEGIGMRHIIDYYFLLKSMTEDERAETWRLLCDFRCRRFTSALMYVIAVLSPSTGGGNSELLLCRPDEKRGRFLLAEILRGGNFGQYDERLNGVNTMAFWGRFCKYIHLSLVRLRYFPADVFWGYVLRLRLALWRLTGVGI